MIDFVKQQLTELEILNNRDSKLDKTIESNLDTSYCVDVFTSISSKYNSLIIDCLSQLFKEHKEVKDWIEYMLYETDKTWKDNVSHTDGTVHTINDTDTLCNYLNKFYNFKK